MDNKDKQKIVDNLTKIEYWTGIISGTSLFKSSYDDKVRISATKEISRLVEAIHISLY